MAKIQVSTIEMRTNAQVIVLDASFVAKAVRAQCAAENIKPTIRCIDNSIVTEDSNRVFDFIDELVGALLDEKNTEELKTKKGLNDEEIDS